LEQIPQNPARWGSRGRVSGERLGGTPLAPDTKGYLSQSTSQAEISGPEVGEKIKAALKMVLSLAHEHDPEKHAP
jgi:hypothetical protein